MKEVWSFETEARRFSCTFKMVYVCLALNLRYYLSAKWSKEITIVLDLRLKFTQIYSNFSYYS